MAEDVTTTGGPAQLHRRRVLIGAGAVGLAGVLAACGGDEDTSAGSGASTSPQSPDGGGAGSPDSEATGESGDAADDGADEGATDEGGGGGDAEGLVAAADVPVGGGVILAESEVVITQPSEGEFRGFSSTCTHLGCTVASVSEGLIRCPCHGSRYFIEDGTVENGPATQPLGEVAVTEQNGQIVQG